MRILISEDDFASRKFITKLLSKYGDCDVTVNGREAVDAYILALSDSMPYELICLDIMMPELDGIKALQAIREIEKQYNIEKEKRAKIIITSALNDLGTVENSFDIGCEAFVSKPLDIKKFLELLKRLGIKE